MPFVLEYLFGLHFLGIYHQAARVAVETMHHVGCATLVAAAEIVVEHGLHRQRRMACRHRKDTSLLLHDHKVAVFIHQPHIAAFQLGGLLHLAHGNLHSGFEAIVELGYDLAAHPYAASLKGGLHLRAALLQVSQKPLKQFAWRVDHIVVIMRCFSFACKVKRKIGH